MIYPMNIGEFGNEALCQEYLFDLKYKNGFICEKCGSKEYWVLEVIKLHGLGFIN